MTTDRSDVVTHPSIQGLREAVAEALRTRWQEFENRQGQALTMPTATVAVEAAAAYLTEHGVLLSGEGLVRAGAKDTEQARAAIAYGAPQLYALVPIEVRTPTTP